MTFDESAVARDAAGKFGEKTGGAPEVALDADKPLDAPHRRFTERRQDGRTIVKPIRGISDDWQFIDSRVEHLAAVDGLTGTVTPAVGDRIYDVTVSRETDDGPRTFTTTYRHPDSEGTRPVKLLDVMALAATDASIADEYKLTDSDVGAFSGEYAASEDPRETLEAMHSARDRLAAFLGSRDRYADYVYGPTRDDHGFGPGKYAQE